MLGVNSDFPFYYFVLCILVGLVYSSFLYISEKSANSSKLNWLLFFFRTIFTSILTFLLLNPVIKSNVNITEKPIVIIAKDDSESIKEDINKNLQFLSESFKGFEVFKFSFSDKIHEGFSQNNTGLKTNYSQFFSEIRNRFENRNVAGVIIASDGCYNAGSNPEYLSYEFPVYSIAIGDTATYKDVRIDDVLINDIAFLGNTFSLEISLASSVANNEYSELKIWNNGVQVHEESIILLKDVNYNTYTVYLPADKIGLQTYDIQVEALSDEKNIINNSFKAYIDVIDSRCNILILKDASSPDLAAYKSSIEENKNFQIEVKNISDSVIIEKYQLVVTFGVKNIPASIVNNNIPLIIFNASQSDYINFESPLSFTKKGGVEEVRCYKNKSFSKFSFSAKLLRLIADAPPLFTVFGGYDFDGYVEFVLSQKIGVLESNKPVIMLHELDSRKVVYVTAEGWWKWKLYDYSINNNNNAFEELFLKLTQYLVLQEDKSLFRLQYERKYDENNEVTFHAELYNESYELVNDNEISLKLFDDNDREYNFQFSRENNKYVAKIGALEVGNYNFAAAVIGTEMMKRGVFDVKKVQLEQLGLSANHQVLNKIAKVSNGKVFYLNGIEDLLETINDSDKNRQVVHSKEKLESIINMPFILLSLLILIAIEWFVRKYNGLI